MKYSQPNNFFFYLFWKLGVISNKDLVHVLCKEGDLTSIKYSAKGTKDDDDDNNNNNNNPDYSKEKGYKCRGTWRKALSDFL